MSNNTLFTKALEQEGIEFQFNLAIEECGELIVALSQLKRGRDADVIEEIADVKIMVDILTIIFGSDKIDEVINQKVDRLKFRLDNSLIEKSDACS